MSALTPSAGNHTTTITINWPDTSLPAADQRIGMTVDHLDAINGLNDSMKGAINDAFNKLTAQLKAMQGDLSKLKAKAG